MAHILIFFVHILCGRLGSPHFSHVYQPILSGICCLCFMRFLDRDTLVFGTAINKILSHIEERSCVLRTSLRDGIPTNWYASVYGLLLSGE